MTHAPNPVRFSRLAVCALALVSGLVWAGPAEDAAAAENSLRSGDLITAMQLFRKAADAGHAPAQARMGDMMDVADQNTEAVAWYRKAAEQGEAAGDHGLARMHLEGKGVARDPALALTLFQKAAQKNFAPSLETLARAYRLGSLGLPKDLQEAVRLEAQAKALRSTQSTQARP